MKCWNGDLIDRYKISSVINPFYLDMDLNSDGKEEIAISIINSQGKRGILIIDPENCSFIVLGAGESFGNGGDDFKWMHVWKVHPKNIPVEIGAGEDSPISLMGDAIYVAKPEAASALIYWDGGQYRWYQQGD